MSGRLEAYVEPSMSDFAAYCEKHAAEHDRLAAALAGDKDRWEDRRHHQRMALAYRNALTIVGAFLS